MKQETIKRIEYLAAARRAQLDYKAKSMVIAKGRLSRRHERQANQHARKANHLASEIISILDIA
jgi:hypothetical protein